ncbi:MAG: hypothetical protein BWY91_02716 [bacterium ADurb.BinA028]|nr:MAG: hypothetical protein BWY91_02716 [bacterium ADurb.BinA028]
MVGAGRVARSRPDALVVLGDEGLVAQPLSRVITPELAPDPLVQTLGEGLGEPVGERLQQDRRIVVQVGLERGHPRGQVDASGHREGAHVVAQARGLRGDEVGVGPIRYAVAVRPLLTQVVQDGADLGTGLRGIHLDVLAHGVGGEQPDDARRPQPTLSLDPVEHGQRVGVELARGLAAGGVVEQVGEATLELPRGEKRLPVDVFAQLGHGVVAEHAGELGDVSGVRARGRRGDVAGLLQQQVGPQRLVCRPVHRGRVGPGRFQRDQLPVTGFGGMPDPDRVVVGLDVDQQPGSLFVGEQRGCHRHRSGGVLDPDDRTVVARGHLDGRVGL